MTTSLTPKTIPRIVGGEVGFSPVVQILDLRQIPGKAGASGNTRYRVIISDGEWHYAAMLATQMNNLVDDGRLKNLALVRLNDFLVNTIQQQKKKIVILLRVDVEAESQAPIGHAKPFDESNSTNYNSSTSAQPPPMRTNRPPSDPVNHQRPQYDRPAPSNSSRQSGGSFPAQQDPSSVSSPSYARQPSNNSSNNSYTNNNNNNNNSYSNQNNNNRSSNNSYTNNSSSYNSNSSNNNNSYGSNNSYGASSSNQQKLFRVVDLNPYVTRWSIQVRITNKGDMRTWSNVKGTGNLFSVTMLDNHGGMIRGTFFKQDADKWYPILEMGQTYTVTGGRLKQANKQYTSVPHDYEITFGNETEFVNVADDGSIQSMNYSIKTIDKIQDTEPGKLIDILGVVRDVEQSMEITTKTGRQLNKRNITFGDSSGFAIRLTAWGESASDPRWDTCQNALVAINAVKVSDYGGRSLSMGFESQPDFQPSFPDAQKLRKWWHEGGESSNFQSLSMNGGANVSFADRKAIGQIVEEGLGTNPDQPDVISVKATISYCKHDDPEKIAYPSCPDDKCKKKMQQLTEGWTCEKCDKTYPDPKYRYLLNLHLMDSTGMTFVGAFGDDAIKIMKGREAHDVMELCNMEPCAYEGVFKDAVHESFVFKLKVKQEMYQETEKLKVSVLRVTPMNYVTECADLLEAIEKI